MSPGGYGAKLPLAACALALAFLGAATGARADVTVDPAHTSATFSVRHLTITTVSGTIGLKRANLVLGPNHVPASASATFDLSTIDTQQRRRDDDLRSDHWFDIALFPTMTFTSTKITPGASGAFAMTGDLTFHGITKPVTLAAKFEGSVKDDKGRTHLGYSATTTLDRTAWNLGTGDPPALVGNDVTVTIELEAIET